MEISMRFRHREIYGYREIQDDSDTEQYTDTGRFNGDFDTEKYKTFIQYITWRFQGDSYKGK